MRLHHLEIQAFGPFSGIVEIDFDELNAAGQFLISGATGSGKTFILDAICFALYGEVPGERQRAKHLRSDHAAPGAEPRVTLTLTVAERLLRITRSPAWERPKRRGEGTTTQQASVRLEQQQDGDWAVLATRLDEAGHLINTWLGMTAVQFTQVALLPQGGFQTFLHAPSATRQAILQRLFRTDRFERIEKWFGELRRSLNRAQHEAQHQLDLIAHRLAEATQSAPPPQVNRGIEQIIEWSTSVSDVVREQEHETAGALQQAAARQAGAAAELSKATLLKRTIDRRTAADKDLRALEDSAVEFAEALRTLEDHQRAESLLPLIRANHDAETAHTGALTRFEQASESLALEDESTDLDQLLSKSLAAVADAERATSLTAKVATVRADLITAQDRWASSSADLIEARTAAASVPSELSVLAIQIDAATAANRELSAVESRLRAARAGLAAATDLIRVQEELTAKEAQHRSGVDQFQDLRQMYLDAREARIEAMASELASALVVGCSCPVCGSTAHPSPAPATSSVGRKREERARRAYEDASIEVSALAEVVAGLKAQVGALTVATRGLDLAQWRQQSSEAADQYEALQQKAAGLASLREQEADLRENVDEGQQVIEALIHDEAQTQAAAEQVDRLHRELEEELAIALGDHADAATFERVAKQRAADIRNAVAARRSLDEAGTIWQTQMAAADRQARVLGFDASSAAEKAVLPAENVREITDRAEQRSMARITAEAVLNDPAVRAVADAAVPDVDRYEHLAAEADTQLALIRTQHDIALRRVERARTINAELDKALDRYRPLEKKSAQVAALSGLLEGTGADNRLRMRLSAFVLAERLRQVVAAANARLEVISEGRYVLNYREERGAGDSRGGLSLSVLDEWTGVRRDPTTLSGGETFVVSLCLALGLADTVADESGGLRIDTLFIDEGFGSLDAETLDSVIDILGQLSQGGRVTGIVSHVQELRERLPVALEVKRGKSGSTVQRASA